MSITNGIVSSKIYDKRDDFKFEIVIFPFLDGDIPRSPSYVCLIDLILYVPSTIFQLCRDGSSWVEPVLS